VDPKHDLAEHVPGSEAFMRLRGIGGRVLRSDRNLELRRFDGAVQPREFAIFSRAALATRLFSRRR
jgi:hypothetical protein